MPPVYNTIQDEVSDTICTLFANANMTDSCQIYGHS